MKPVSRLELLECLKEAIQDAKDAKLNLTPETRLADCELESMDALIVWEAVTRRCQLPGLPLPKKFDEFTVGDLMDYVKSHLTA
jgi:hypothetical protein